MYCTTVLFPVAICPLPLGDLLKFCRGEVEGGSAWSEFPQSCLFHTWMRLLNLKPKNEMSEERGGVPDGSCEWVSEVKTFPDAPPPLIVH